MQSPVYAISSPVPTWRPDVEQGDKPMLTPVPAIFVTINEAITEAYIAGRWQLVNRLLELKMTVAHEHRSRQTDDA